MKAKLKKHTTVREDVEVTLSIQEAHLIDTLLGNTPDNIAEAFGVKELSATWHALNRALGHPLGKYIKIEEG